MCIKINNCKIYMNKIINAKKKVNKSLEQIKQLKEYFSDKSQELIYRKESNKFVHKELIDTLEDLEYDVDSEFNELVQLYRENTEDAEKLNNVIVEKGSNYTREKLKSNRLNQEKDGTEELKINQYDVNIVDNMYVIYYFLSYGIIGLFIYKLLKQ